MRQYSFMDSRLAKAVFWPYLTAMLFLSRDTLFSSSILGFQTSQLCMLALIAILGIWFLVKNRRDIKEILLDRRMAAMVFSAVVLLVPMIAKQDWQLMYFSVLLCLLFAVFLTYFTTSREVARYYVVILCVLGVYSVIATYGLQKLARAGILSPEVFYNSSEWDFYDFGFAYAVTWKHWHRNFGIFREPGVYQFFILLAVYLNNYMVDWKKAWQLWTCNVILAVTMVSTFAIGGFAELGLFVVFLYFDRKFYRHKWGRIAAAAAILAVLGFLGFMFWSVHQEFFEGSIFYEIYDMYLRLFTQSDSATDRMDAIVTNLQIFTRNPLVGDAVSNVLHGTNHNTSSTLLLFAILGVAGGCLHVASWVALAWKRERNILGNLMLLLAMFMSFNTQNLVANVFFWLFPMMTLVERGLPRLKLPARKV